MEQTNSNICLLDSFRLSRPGPIPITESLAPAHGWEHESNPMTLFIWFKENLGDLLIKLAAAYIWLTFLNRYFLRR